MNKADLFPPHYSSDGFVWSTPFVIGPSILLGIIVLFGLPRYLHNRFHEASTNPRPLSAFSKFIVFLALIITTTFLIDAIVIVARAIVEDLWTSSVLAYYIGVSWSAWTLSLGALADETQKFSQWYWVQYLFWIIAVLNETFVGWLWMMGVLKPVPGKYFQGVVCLLMDTSHKGGDRGNTFFY